MLVELMEVDHPDYEEIDIRKKKFEESLKKKIEKTNDYAMFN